MMITHSVVMRLQYFTVLKMLLTVGLDKHYFLVRLESVLKRGERWDDVVCNFKRLFLLQPGRALCQMLPAHIYLAPPIEQWHRMRYFFKTVENNLFWILYMLF